MEAMLPEELVEAIAEQWPCRQLQIRQLAALLHPSLPSSSNIIVHGPEACGKSGIVRAVLDAYTYSNATPTATTTTKADDVPAIKKRKRRQIEPNNDHDPAQGNSLRYSLVKVAECITTRHLLTKLVSAVLDAVRPSNSSSPAHITEEEWVEIAKGARCEHVSSLPGVLGEILCRARCEKFVLVLDGVDDLREGGQMLLAALARVGETVRPLCVVFVLKLSPRPLLLQVTGVPHVYFPPYTRVEAVSIVTRLGPPEVPGLSEEVASRLYGPFVSTLYDSLVGPMAGSLPDFQSVARDLWPRFVSPIVNGENPPGRGQGAQWDFPKLLVKNRGLFQQQGELALVHHIIPSVPTIRTNMKKNATSPLPSLPYTSTLILAAAFLAAHTPPRTDIVFFSKFASSRNKRIRRRKREPVSNDGPDDPTATPSKSGKKSNNATVSSVPGARGSRSNVGLSNPRPFPLERLLAIIHAIDPNPSSTRPMPIADLIYPEVATLQRLRLLVPASSAAAATRGAIDGGEKWCLNVDVAVGSGLSHNGEWMIEMGKSIGVDIEEYVAALLG